MGTAKWRLALWRYNLKIWARKREGERRSDLNDTNIAWPVRASGPCGRKVAAYFFLQLQAFLRVCSRRFESWFFLDSFSVVWRKHVDMWTELDTNERRVVCPQRCLRRLFGGFLYTCLLQVRQTRTGFPAGRLHSICVGYFFVEGKVRLKEKD